MAARAATRCSYQYLSTRLVPGSSKSPARVPLAASLILCREYHPYSKFPKKYFKKKENKENDVYFLHNHSQPKHFLNEAIDCMRAYALFGPQPIDLILQLDMGEDKKKIRVLQGLMHFPKPFTKPRTKKRILVFAEGEAAEQARKVGGAIVGGVEMIKQVEDNTVRRFDHCLSTLDFLPNIKHLPKILQARMPNVRRGTATNDICSALERYRTIERYEATREGAFRKTVAWTNFTNDEIRKNVIELVKAIDSHKTLPQKIFYKHARMVSPIPGLELDLVVEDIVP